MSGKQRGFSRYTFLQLFCWIGVGMISNVANAAAAQPEPTITIDVNNPNGSVDYAQVDKFIAAENTKQVKFAAVENGDLILSDKPILKIQKHLYKPGSLADLGWRVRTGYAIYNWNVVKVPDYRVASRELRKLPVIPNLPIFAATPGLTALPPSTWTVIINQSKVMSSPTVVVDATLWMLSAISILLIGGLFVQSRSRRFREREVSYAGEVGAPHEMIGKGELFDFRDEAIGGKAMPINSTYLNILWNVGKFSQQGAVDTYFYMAFYIPTTREYATVLRKKQKVKHEEQA